MTLSALEAELELHDLEVNLATQINENMKSKGGNSSTDFGQLLSPEFDAAAEDSNGTQNLSKPV